MLRFMNAQYHNTSTTATADHRAWGARSWSPTAVASSAGVHRLKNGPKHSGNADGAVLIGRSARGVGRWP